MKRSGLLKTFGLLCAACGAGAHAACDRGMCKCFKINPEIHQRQADNKLPYAQVLTSKTSKK